MNPSEVASLGDDGGIELPPIAPLLLESLRAVGYTAPAAIADLVDNSIAANASQVSIRFVGGATPFVAILDNGDGMSDAELIEAMRFGSQDPRMPRSKGDLGRFGLGLKTASLSQCRRVTVASLSAKGLAARTWDLDECERRQSWWLEKPAESQIVSEILDLLKGLGHGTAVIWEKLDRLYPIASTAPLRQLEVAMEGVADHLALIFHRFLSGEMRGDFVIDINDRRLPILDPFLSGHLRGQSLRPEKFAVEGHEVVVTPHVLPFPSRLEAAEMDRMGGRESIKTAHGFYIYRGGRLMVPGGWYRIVPSDELVRLARIQVDVPIALDHIWKVDVRKTMAEPPIAIRPNLKRIVGAVTNRSKAVYKHRGIPLDLERVSLWHRVETRDDAITWKINRDHPAIQVAVKPGASKADIERTYRLIEESVPFHDIYVHISNDQSIDSGSDFTEQEQTEFAMRLLDAFADAPAMRDAILTKLHLTEPFSADPEMAKRIAERLRQ